MEIKTIGVTNPFNLNSQTTKTNNKNDNVDFGTLLSNALDKVNELEMQSNEYKKLLATGDIDNLHDVTIAAEKANIALQLTLSIRNKVVEAYQEIMRMQV